MTDRAAADLELARRAAGAMWADDRASRAIGIVLDSVWPGAARVSLPVRADLLDADGTVANAVVFALADSAFALACNSHGIVTVAASVDMVRTGPARLGDVLVAEAVERSTVGRAGVTDVTVTTAHGAPVAEFRGHSRSLGRPIELDHQSEEAR